MYFTLNDIVRYYGSNIEECIELDLLNQLTTWFEPEYLHALNWERVRELHILGTVRDWEAGPPIIDAVPLKQGCYVDETGAWVLLTGPDTGAIQQCVDHCPPGLKKLFIGHTNIAALTLPPLKQLYCLQLIHNSNLVDISGLYQLPVLKQLVLYYFGPSFLLDLTPYSQLQQLTVAGTGIAAI